MKVTGWKSSRGGGTFGLRVGKQNAKEFFDKTWHFVDVDFEGKRVTINITESFWASCPELRDPFVRVYLEMKGMAHWPKRRPPKMELTPCGGNRFRVSVK